MWRVRHVRHPVVVRKPLPRLLRFLRAGDSLKAGGGAVGSIVTGGWRRRVQCMTPSTDRDEGYGGLMSA